MSYICPLYAFLICICLTEPVPVFGVWFLISKLFVTYICLTEPKASTLFQLSTYFLPVFAWQNLRLNLVPDFFSPHGVVLLETSLHGDQAVTCQTGRSHAFWLHTRLSSSSRRETQDSEPTGISISYSHQTAFAQLKNSSVTEFKNPHHYCLHPHSLSLHTAPNGTANLSHIQWTAYNQNSYNLNVTIIRTNFLTHVIKLLQKKKTHIVGLIYNHFPRIFEMVLKQNPLFSNILLVGFLFIFEPM